MFVTENDNEWPMVSTRGTVARRGIDREISIVAREVSDGIRFGIRSSNANRSISSLKELHQILSGRSIMAGCLKPGLDERNGFEELKKRQRAQDQCLLFPPPPPRPCGHTRDAAYRASACLEARKQRIRAIMDRRVVLGSPLRPTKGSWPYTANYEVFHDVLGEALKASFVPSLIAKFSTSWKTLEFARN